MKSKTIIISSQGENNNLNGARGILTLYEDVDILKCKLRLYNSKKPNRNCRLGLYYQDEVYSANILDKGSFFESSFAGHFNIEKDFYCAVIDTDNNNQIMLAGGTYAGYYYDDNSVFSSMEEKPEPNKSPVQENITPHQCFNSSDEEEKCASCKYKEYFYNDTSTKDISEMQDSKTSKSKIVSKESVSSIQMSNEKAEMIDSHNKYSTNECIDKTQLNIINTTNDNHVVMQPETLNPKLKSEDDNKESDKRSEKIDASFLQAMIPQFEYIFENYQQNEELTNLVNNSKFVLIQEASEQYSIGAIYENEEMKYICYAIKCNYNEPVPSELGVYYQWLPIDNEDPLSEGYYIVYQDSTDLKIIEV